MNALTSKIKQNPKSIFLLDGIGALLTAFLIFVVLRPFNESIGLPKNILVYLSIIAAVFSIYSLSCYCLIKEQWPFYLRIISLANIVYCCLTIITIIYFHESIRIIGICYFVGESITISLLVYMELYILKTYASKQA